MLEFESSKEDSGIWFPSIAQCHSLNDTSFSLIHQEYSIPSDLITSSSVVCCRASELEIGKC